VRATYQFDMFSVRYHRSIAAFGESGQALGRDEDPPVLELYGADGRQSFHDFGRPRASGHGFGADTRLIRHFFDCIEKRLASPFTTEAVVDSVAVPLARSTRGGPAPSSTSMPGGARRRRRSPLEPRKEQSNEHSENSVRNNLAATLLVTRSAKHSGHCLLPSHCRQCHKKEARDMPP